MKILILFVILFTPICQGVEVVVDLFSTDIKFNVFKQSETTVDSFESSLWPRFQPPEIPEPVWGCGIIPDDTLPEKRFTIEFLGYKESWIPLFGDVKREPIWLYTL